MGLLEKVYDASPIFFQHVMASISGYHRNQSRYGRVYHNYLRFLADFDTWTLDQKLEYQRQELVKFIAHAFDNSKFYRRLYQDIDITTINGMEDLKALPIVNKEMLRENIADVITISRHGGVESHTGGTTGKSLVVLFTKEDFMKRMAMLDHFKARVGFEHRKMKRATFGGKHIVPPNQKQKVFWRYIAACKQMYYSSFHITEGNIKYYIDSLNKYKPQAIDGFFMSICDIASYIERHDIQLTFTPVAIFPTSETLTQTGRELLERVFRCKVYDQYASSEGAPFVTECPNQTPHVELASGVFECFEEGSNEVLVTSFTTHGTPLIRYRIGDSMKFADENLACNCGIKSPVVLDIEGRRLDFLYTADGARINAGNISNLFKNMPNAIIRAQAIQNKMDEIKIKIEVDKNLYKDKYDDLLKDEFVHKFGLGTKVLIEHVESIPREQSGKHRMIINNLEC